MKHALISGGNKGLGLETAKAFINAGWKVFSIGRTQTSEAEELTGDSYQHIIGDLSDPNAVKSLLKDNDLLTGIPIHAFVNNAASAYDDIITNANVEALQDMFRINVHSPIMLCKYVIRNMLLHDIKGSIVHISSISAHTGYKGLSMYAASKGALEAFSKNTAREWGSKGIRSNAVVAGFMETEMSASLTDEQRERIYKRTSLKKATSTNSVASTIVHLCSEGASSITGQNIFVDNGTI